MSDHYSANTARIRALKTSVVSLLDPTQEEPVSNHQLDQGVELLTEAFQDVLNLGSKQLLQSPADNFTRALQAIESAYKDWRDVETAFEHTLAAAYNGYSSRDNLFVDSTYVDLRQRVGEPVSALRAKVHTAWHEHIRINPWDEFMGTDNHTPNEELDSDLKALIFGDHLDLEDAVERLMGPLRYAFASYLSLKTEPLDDVEDSLWLRPEIMLINDYWRFNRQNRIIDTVCRKGRSKRTLSFAHIQNFFAADGYSSGGSESIVGAVNALASGEKATYYRCLMLHPNQEVRRYAVNNVDFGDFWKVITPNAVPCATILSMLERVADSKAYDDNFQKVFFHAVHKRLFNITSRSELIYARGIIRIFTRLPFFMEDEYFEKLTGIVDYIHEKERILNFNDGMLDEYIRQLNNEKDKIGTLQTSSSNLTSIPPVVLRKLARDGHYWYDLAMHPTFKIARETIPHINTPDRAARVARNPMTSSDVLREVGRKRSLFRTQTAKMELLSNPRTPPTVSAGYLMDLTKPDAERLLRKSTIHPELRLQLRRHANPSG
jgi:hypothetical protein